MAITLNTVAKTAFGSIAGNTEMYTGANVDALFTDALAKIDAKLAAAMHYKGTVADMDALNAVVDPEVGDVYNVTATGDNYAFDGTSWDKLSGVIDLTAYKTDAQNELKYLQLKTAGTAATAGALATLDEVAEANLAAALAQKINGKVDAVAGKQLSTEDYTTAEKTKLDGIEAGAQVNVQADWSATEGDALILNKPTLGALAAKDKVAISDLDADAQSNISSAALTAAEAKVLAEAAGGKADAAHTQAERNTSKFVAIANVTAPAAMPTKDTVTLYSLYDAVDSIRTAVAAVITAVA